MELIAWYIGACLAAFAIGFCAGLTHRAFTQVMESAT
jgi:hypothetical protein